MITNPTPQRALRGRRPGRSAKRPTARDLSAVAGRLTPRDRWIIRMLWEHRVLTSRQLAAMAFPSADFAGRRLRRLYGWGLIDRFQPYIGTGTAPLHFVVAPLGAVVLAAEDGLDLATLHYRHERAMAIAHSLRLAHTVGVGDFFTALVHHARALDDDHRTQLVAWWSETRCAAHFGDLVKPDAYGRWRADGTDIEFFLEFDFGTEALGRVAAKLAGYAALAESTGITTPLLVWLPGTEREATARRVLHEAARGLANPASVPVATGNPDLLNAAETAGPAGPVWLPLDARRPGRRELHRLPALWPHLTPPSTTGGQAGPLASPDAPSPTAPLATPRPSGRGR